MNELHTYNQLYQAISNGWFSISIYDGIALIGYERITSDRNYQTFICDVMVYTKYQRQGIATKVIEAFLAQCKRQEIK
ncbi:GNAT family N-acetyltransferase [Lysinibacillus sp. NPDC096418]|uniref:GNAT family N-acetyltransferase n=1 Tax=Lysinibacillus sp. NPDC096418 TaxID=3364138 RepID=UPI0038182FFA